MDARLLFLQRVLPSDEESVQGSLGEVVLKQ